MSLLGSEKVPFGAFECFVIAVVYRIHSFERAPGVNWRVSYG
jgi:hypothetical protein